MKIQELIKKEAENVTFRPDAFEYDTRYVVEVKKDGISKLWKTIEPPQQYSTIAPPPLDPNNKKMHFGYTTITMFNNVIERDPIDDPLTIPHIPSRHKRYHVRMEWNPGVTEHISISALCVKNGDIIIRHEDGTPVEDPTTVTEYYGFDGDKIEEGSIWKLTIDGDPRFQNTLIMIMRVDRSIRFLYQAKVIYSDDYSKLETAEGFIELYNSKGEMNDLTSVDLELVHQRSNPGCDMDRTNDEIIYPQGYNGYREAYPGYEFAKRGSDRRPWGDSEDPQYRYMDE